MLRCNTSGVKRKTESRPEEPEEKLSVCEIMKDDTSEILRKMESQAPLLFQNYSNLYTQHLHMLDDMFGTGFIAEKKFFDRLDISPEMLKHIKTNSGLIKNLYVQNIETSSQFLDMYVKMRMNALKSFDNYTHVLMNSYANMLSQFD